jgi:uncharacterized protein (TIGR03382 family)
MNRSAALLAFVLATLPALAQADVGPAPTCPAGLRSAYWMGRFCAVVPCTSDAECGDGATCETRAYCVDAREGTPDVGFAGTCENGAACPGSATCSTQRYCGAPSGGAAAPPAPGNPPTTEPTSPAGPSAPASSRGCSAAPGQPAGALAGTLLLIGVVLGLRRRR